MTSPLPSAANPAVPKGSRRRLARVVLWLLGALALFFVGRHFSYLSTDFIVYYQAARSFLAGRTDLYSATFAWGPPMEYVYPPLFLLLFFPLGWLPFADAFGIWFAALALATVVVIWLAYREWHPVRAAAYWVALVTLAAVPVVYALRNGNVHLGVVLLTLAGLVAWSKGKSWTASFYLAFAGAIKLFPLFLFPFFIVRREWKLALKLAFLSCLFWAAPLAYYGPRQTIGLYRSWYHSVPGDVERFEDFHQLDSSLTGTTRRWLSHIDYSRHRDMDHPEVNRLDLSAGTVRTIAQILRGLVMGVSLLVASVLPRLRLEAHESGPSQRRLEVAIIASLFITSQLLFGPYTIFLYLCEWLVVVLTLPVVLQQCAARLNYWLLATGVASLVILAVPGHANHRALEAYGVFTLLNTALWLISLVGAWKWWRASRLHETGE